MKTKPIYRALEDTHNCDAMGGLARSGSKSSGAFRFEVVKFSPGSTISGYQGFSPLHRGLALEGESRDPCPVPLRIAMREKERCYCGYDL